MHCCGLDHYHRHCVVCRAPLSQKQRMFCSQECRFADRNGRCQRCFVQPVEGGPRRVRWLPRMSPPALYTGVQASGEASGPILEVGPQTDHEDRRDG